MSTTGQTSARYRDGAYLAANPGWHEENSAWKAEKIRELARRNHLQPRRVCELGCGAGEILASLQRTWASAQFVGCDISPQALGIARKKSNENLVFILGDVDSVPAVDFDMLLAIDVFEHVEDYMGLLRKLRTKAKYKVFHIPLDLSAQGVAREAMMAARAEAGHLHYFSKQTALATLADCGYEIVDAFYTARALDFPGKAVRTRLMKWPRALAFRLYPDFAALLLGGFSLMVLTK